MKILVSIYSLHRGGAERVVSRLSQEWAKDHEVIIALSDTSDSAYTYGGRIVDMRCEAQHSLMKKGMMVLKRIFTLVSVIRKEKPDTIITFMDGSNFPAVGACFITGTLDKLSVSIRNNPDGLRKFYTPLFSLVYRFPRRVVAVSEGVRFALVHDYHLSSERVVTISNPLDLQEIHRMVDKTCGLDIVSDNTIIAAGRLMPQKGFDVLIRAYALARKDERMKDTNLIIMGEEEAKRGERQKLEELITSLDMEEHVFLPGNIENPFACFSRAGMFVLSSHYEGMPNVLLEAMASGIPVLSTDCKYGPSEIISHEENGLLVPVDDTQALSRAIIQMAEMGKDMRKTFIKRSYDIVQKRNIQSIASQWL